MNPSSDNNHFTLLSIFFFFSILLFKEIVLLLFVRQNVCMTVLNSYATWGNHISSSRVDLMCTDFLCVQTMIWLPMLGICHMHTDSTTGNCTWGLCKHHKRVLKVNPGRKISCRTSQLNLCEEHTRPEAQPAELLHSLEMVGSASSCWMRSLFKPTSCVLQACAHKRFQGNRQAFLSENPMDIPLVLGESFRIGIPQGKGPKFPMGHSPYVTVKCTKTVEYIYNNKIACPSVTVHSSNILLEFKMHSQIYESAQFLLLCCVIIPPPQFPGGGGLYYFVRLWFCLCVWISSGQYLLTHSTIFNQTWYHGVLS